MDMDWPLTRDTCMPDSEHCLASAATTHQVTLLPSGFIIEAETGEKLVDAARRNGIRWPRVCGGVGDCGVCYAEVVPGLPDSPPAAAERSLLKRVPAGPAMGGEMRLACCVNVDRDMVIYRFGIRTPQAAG